MIIQEGEGQSVFNYSTLKVFLDKATKSLSVLLHRPDHGNRINQEMLFELETLFSWISGHLEIQSILLSSSSSHFGEGLDLNELRKLDQEKLQKFLFRLQRLIYSFFHLPQTIVVDLKSGAKGASVELALGADLRISHQKAMIQFDHLLKGLSPCCGGIGPLGALIPKAYVKNWILSSGTVETSRLLESGFLLQTYPDIGPSDISPHKTIMEQIRKQGPIQRIQAKRAFLESMDQELKAALQWESGIGWAGLVMEDWKEALAAEEAHRPPSFTDPRDLAKILRNLKESTKEDTPSC